MKRRRDAANAAPGDGALSEAAAGTEGEAAAEGERWRRERAMEAEGAWPPPVTSFGALPARFPHLAVSAALLRLLAGHAAPTAVQAAVMPAALALADLLVCAPTGAGKTLAFVVPLCILLSSMPQQAGPQALVLAPTRELAAQLEAEAERVLLAASPALRVARLVGGEASAAQEAAARGAAIVVATPGRLAQAGGRDAALLAGVRVAVLDEADRLLASGDMQEQVAAILRLCAHPERRTWLFSATVPEAVERVARAAASPVLRLRVGAPARPPLELRVAAHQLPASARLPALLRLLRATPAPPALVFCNTHEAAVRVGRLLRAEQFHVAVLSGALDHAQRTRAVAALREGGADVLVASPVAARGLDFPGLALVVLYDTPPSAPELLHRAGRTGRAGRVGRVECFLDPGGVAPDVRRLLLDLGLAPHALPASRDDVK